MSNFKVGDVVERKKHNRDIFLRLVGPGPHVVTGVSNGGHWIQINNYTDMRGADLYPWSAGNFTLVTEQDDPLPPVPESVRYATLQYGWQDQYNDQCLTVGPDTFQSAISLHIQGNSNSTRNKDMSLSVVLDADDVLRLAHDLRRIAMDIKRKEKQHV